MAIFDAETMEISMFIRLRRILGIKSKTAKLIGITHDKYMSRKNIDMQVLNS